MENTSVKTIKSMLKKVAAPSLEDYQAYKKAEAKNYKKLEKNPKSINISAITNILLNAIREVLKEESIIAKIKGVPNVEVEHLTPSILKKAIVKTLITLAKSLALGYEINLYNFGKFTRTLVTPHVDKNPSFIGSRVVRAFYKVKFVSSSYINNLFRSSIVKEDPESKLGLEQSNEKHLDTVTALAEKYGNTNNSPGLPTELKEPASIEVGPATLSKLEITMRKILIRNEILSMYSYDLNKHNDLVKTYALYNEYVKSSVPDTFWDNIKDFPKYFYI